MADTVVQSQDTTFQRVGDTWQLKGYALPSVVYNPLYWLLGMVPAVSLTTAEQQFLANLLAQDPEILPGGLTLYQMQALNPLTFAGAAELESLFQLDPFSTDYETGTKTLYDRQFATARATAQSGPINVRGGTARQAFELAELSTLQAMHQFQEIWKNQISVAQIVLTAVRESTTVTNAIRALQLKSQEQQAATEQGRVMQSLSAAEQSLKDRESWLRTVAGGAEFLGVPEMHTEESLQGRGYQQGITTSFGMSSWR